MRAVLETDVPVAIKFALSTCIVVVLGSLLADVLYALVDPGVRQFGE